MLEKFLATKIHWWRYGLSGLIVLSVMTLSSCYYDYGLTVEDFDVVATFFDRNASHGSYRTYAMPDSIVHIVEEGETSDLSRRYDKYILDQVASNLELLGYQRIANPDPDTNKPDVLVLLAATDQQNYVAYVDYPYYGYWGWYYPGYPPGWGGWYPWYPGGTIYTYSTGTLFVNMVDVDKVDPDEQLVAIVWTAAVNGLLGDTSTNVTTRLRTSISQAFIQSPYLTVKQ